MSVPKPTPNNLTLVRFGPLSVDFTKTGTYTLGAINYDENTFIPTSSFIVYTNALGTNGTPAIVAIDNGTTGENIATGTLIAVPVSTSPNASGNLSQQALTAQAASGNGYVLGNIPVANPNPASGSAAGGAAATQSVRVNVTTAAIPGLASTNRVTANNISTITVSSVPSWLVAGVTVKVQSIGNAAYNGFVTVLSTTATTFSYYNPSLTTEASTADTAGRIGAITGDVYVTGYLF
jgi:hypothetical protein